MTPESFRESRDLLVRCDSFLPVDAKKGPYVIVGELGALESGGLGSRPGSVTS